MNYGAYFSSVGEYSDPGLLAELASEAEAVGWDGVFIWDHIGHPNSAVDPWVALAAMAVRTQRVKLGPIVTPVARRRPWKLARETTSLDHLSNGRLVLGVGLGWTPKEFEVFGEAGDLRTRVGKLDEGLEVLVGLWGGEPFSYHGAYYQIEDACFKPQPLQKPRIPIWPCGAWTARKAPFRRAARWDGIVAIADPQKDRAIQPDEVRAIKTTIQQHRSSAEPFDIVVILWSEGGRSQKDLQAAAVYEQAGVTWWLEDLSSERFASLKQARDRLWKGPPGT
jgi:alkanesulfonate monooxygenase SsuD/methylene tetrahydromethanopterin reductase-like flavin-dependent oxidoreductase (luciferase family)